MTIQNRNEGQPNPDKEPFWKDKRLLTFFQMSSSLFLGFFFTCCSMQKEQADSSALKHNSTSFARVSELGKGTETVLPKSSDRLMDKQQDELTKTPMGLRPSLTKSLIISVLSINCIMTRKLIIFVTQA
jgi:hypothetical protein